MTITLGSWVIPAFLTAAIWIYVELQPASRSYGYYDFGFDTIFRGVLAIIATLVIWLIYFAARFALG